VWATAQMVFGLSLDPPMTRGCLGVVGIGGFRLRHNPFRTSEGAP